MRNDVYIKEVLKKYEVLKISGLWPAKPDLRPRAWLNNFNENDKFAAAVLLDNFTYLDDKLINRLVISSYDSILDGFPKGPQAPNRFELAKAIQDAVFTPVHGENPNPSDSGNIFCRKFRQHVKVPQDRIVGFSDALDKAYCGECVVFVDDFIGSGEQFNKTLELKEVDSDGKETGRSFQHAQQVKNFTCIYITLISTQYGFDRIHRQFPETAICCPHVLGVESTVFGLANTQPRNYLDIMDSLKRTSSRLIPAEKHMRPTLQKTYGWHKTGLMLGFEGSVPDATLPIFWSDGTGNWEPLIERK